MNHDELLAEINEAILDFDLKFDNNNPYYKALRAVVELHKPISWLAPDNKQIGEQCFDCSVCGEFGYSGEWVAQNYPCPTIKAIEAELK